MKTFIPSALEVRALQDAAQMLARGNAMTNEGKKLSDTGKEAIAKWLADSRACDVDAQAIGEFVNVQNVALIEIASMSKFDEKAFALAHPDLHAKFKRPVRVVKYKPTV